MVKSSETDINIRKALAWAAFWRMKDIFRSNNLPIRLKTNMFQAACLPILLYGCESWIITEKLKQSLNSFATNCYRVMLNIKRMDKVSNAVIRSVLTHYTSRYNGGNLDMSVIVYANQSSS
ncbi:uncharacterized protein LOC118408508 [Tachysurus ichikawai]